MTPLLATVIMTSVIATSSTGGNYAGPAGRVIEGASSASSYVRTVSGGTSTTSVRIESNSNGNRQIEERVIPPRTPAAIEVRTESRGAAAMTSVRIAPMAASTAPAAPGLVPSLGAIILNFIRSLLDPMAYWPL